MGAVGAWLLRPGGIGGWWGPDMPPEEQSGDHALRGMLQQRLVSPPIPLSGSQALKQMLCLKRGIAQAVSFSHPPRPIPSWQAVIWQALA